MTEDRPILTQSGILLTAKDFRDYLFHLKSVEHHCALCGWNETNCKCERHTHPEGEE